MISSKIVDRLEVLLTYPDDILPHEVTHRLKDVEACFLELYPHVVNFSSHEKGIFFKLLGRSNDLVRRSMDHQMKMLNLTPEKLDKIFEDARNSNSPEARNLISSLSNLEHQVELMKQSLAKVDVKMSTEMSKKGVSQSPQQQRLKRSAWKRP